MLRSLVKGPFSWNVDVRAPRLSTRWTRILRSTIDPQWYSDGTVGRWLAVDDVLPTAHALPVVAMHQVPDSR